MRTRIAVVAVLLPLVAAALSACDDEPEPKVVPVTTTAPPSLSSSTSSAPGTSPPTSASPTTTAPSQETAKEFVVRFQAEGARMKATGETKAYRALSPSCRDCAALAQAVEGIYADGGQWIGTPAKTRSVVEVGKVRGVRILEFTHVAGPSKVVGADGRVTSRFSGGTARFQINIQRMSGQWQVLRISELVE